MTAIMVKVTSMSGETVMNGSGRRRAVTLRRRGGSSGAEAAPAVGDLYDVSDSIRGLKQLDGAR